MPEGNSCALGAAGVATASIARKYDRENHAGSVGQWSLISFLDINNAGQDDPSRSQVVVLQSMLNQYAGKGLNVTAIAGSGATSDLVENRSHDWHVENIQFVADPGSKMAKLHSITAEPTTLLMSSDGRELWRWKGFASAAEIGLRLRSLLGAPSGMAEIPGVGETHLAQ